jgi:hypothetical protein
MNYAKVRDFAEEVSGTVAVSERNSPAELLYLEARIWSSAVPHVEHCTPAEN